MNQAEGIIHDTETKMEEFKDQLPTDEVRTVIKFCKYLGGEEGRAGLAQLVVKTKAFPWSGYFAGCFFMLQENGNLV